jgi:hypothetical protein
VPCGVLLVQWRSEALAPPVKRTCWKGTRVCHRNASDKRACYQATLVDFQSFCVYFIHLCTAALQTRFACGLRCFRTFHPSVTPASGILHQLQG